MRTFTIVGYYFVFLMIGITQYFHHTDTTEEVKDKVRLVFPIFIISISFCILLNKDGYIVAVFSFSSQSS